jgi:hypothetical protein
MSLSKNSILPIDSLTTPVKLKYESTYISNYDNIPFTFPYDPISSTFASNGPVSITGSVPASTLRYRTIQQLYYQNYITSSVLNTSSSWDWYQQSTACSGSSEYENRYIPTGSQDRIAIIAIPPSLFGESISRNTFLLKPVIGSEYLIVDDGNGNLVDRQNSNKHIGNIIYSHGIVIITDVEYAPAFVIPTAAPDSYYTPTGPVAGYVNTTSGLYVEYTP